jgi:hypothetical protein
MEVSMAVFRTWYVIQLVPIFFLPVYLHLSPNGSVGDADYGLLKNFPVPLSRD